jgi:hypothetical protein
VWYSSRRSKGHGKSGKKGSILLEVAIALSVIGLISGFFITKTLVAKKAMLAQITKNNIEIILLAIGSFLANNNRLPLPAPNNEGRERKVDDDLLSNFVGQIPFYTLGILEKNSRDGEGRPLIYTVEPYLTSSSHTKIYEDPSSLDSEYFCRPIASPKIVVTGIPENSKNPIAVIVSSQSNPPRLSEERITISQGPDTQYLSRDMLLMLYLKNSPCQRAALPLPRDPVALAPVDPFNGV